MAAVGPAAAQDRSTGSGDTLSPPRKPRPPALTHRCEISKVGARSWLSRGVTGAYARHEIAGALGSAACKGFVGRVSFSFEIETGGAVAKLAVTGRAGGRACVKDALAALSFRARRARTSVSGTARFGPLFDTFPPAPCAIRGARPRLRVTRLAVRGDQRPAIIRRLFEKQGAKMVACYRAAVFDDPKLAGAVTTEFAVDGGKPVRWMVKGPEPLKACVRDNLPDLRFPRSRTGSMSIIEASLRFDVGP